MSYHPESIVFVADVDLEGNLEASKGVGRFEMIKESILFMASAKKRTNPRHRFALAVLQDDGAEWRMSPFTSSLDALTSAVRALQPSSSCSYPGLELGRLLQLVQPSVQGEQQEGRQVRVVMFYLRSSSVPTWHLHRDCGLAIDAVYIHEKPVAGVNCPQEVFDALEDIVDAASRAAGHHAYIFEASASNVKKLLNTVTWLLAHPAQRVPQQQLRITPVDISAAGAQATHLVKTAISSTIRPGSSSSAVKYTIVSSPPQQQQQQQQPALPIQPPPQQQLPLPSWPQQAAAADVPGSMYQAAEVPLPMLLDGMDAAAASSQHQPGGSSASAASAAAAAAAASQGWPSGAAGLAPAPATAGSTGGSSISSAAGVPAATMPGGDLADLSNILVDVVSSSSGTSMHEQQYLQQQQQQPHRYSPPLGRQQ